MKKFKFLSISKTKKLRFIDNYFKKKLYIVFLPGFMSDVEGEKPRTLKNFAIRNKLGFLALEYLGHGKSSGKFTQGNISIWTNNTKYMIKKIVKNFSKNVKSEIIVLSTLEKKSISRIKSKLISYVS